MSYGWISILKGLGLVLTAVFGVAGQFAEFKENGKVTRWGRRNLVGLVVGLVVSLAVQIGEHVKGSSESAAAANRAADAAAKLESVLGNVQRVGDPLTKMAVEFIVSIPATNELLEHFGRRLDRVKVTESEGDRIVTLGSDGPFFPPKVTEPVAHALLTARTQMFLFFYKEKSDPFDSEPDMSLVVSAAPEGAASLSPPTYNQKTKALYVRARPQMVRFEENYYNGRLTSVRDLVGARLAIEIRDSIGGIPAGAYPGVKDILGSAKRLSDAISLEWLSLEFPGRRELSLVKEDFKRVGRPGKPTYFVFDFPASHEELNRRFSR